MSERKVLNKYYPPDFDPSKIPKLREPKNKTFSIRIMAPFNMRCNVCGEYIYKGKKFNSRKENVDDEDYLGLRIFRFYIRCPKCVAEIAFKTDLRNTDYTLEAGATRLFEAEKLAQQMAERERKEKEEEEMNPMKVLENRTKASHKEMAQIDELEELREINARHAKVDTDSLIEKQRLYEEHLLKLQQQEEDEMVKSIFGTKGQVVKRLADSDSEDEEEGGKPVTKKPAISIGDTATDVLVDATPAAAPSTKDTQPKKEESWKKSVGTLSTKSGLAGLVRKKADNKPSSGQAATAAANSNKQSTGISNIGSSVSLTNGSKNDTAASGSASVKTDNTNSASSQNSAKATANGVSAPASSAANSGTGSALGLLGGYSGSDSDESDQ